jgi:hypothetical protein
MSTNYVMTSPDGIVWTSRTATSSSGWWSVTYANGIFVAVAFTGADSVMTSADGITWTSRSVPEDNEWNSVVYGNGMFVAVASTGTNRIMRSNDAITWVVSAAPEQNGWFSVTYGNGRFVAVSIGGTQRVMTGAPVAAPAPAPAPAGNSAPAVETPTQVIDTGLAARTVSTKKRYSAKALARQVGVPIVSSKATVSISVAKSSKKVCTKSGAKLRTLKAGNCNVTFTVQEPKPKKGKKPKATKTPTTLIVQ